MIFNNKKMNEIKSKDIKKIHKNLKSNEFLRIFLSNGVFIDLEYNKEFTINKDYLSVDKLKTFTKYIVLYDVLELIQNEE